ncbi:peroxiredoxin family protein [Mycobacterium spongiae]|uniref:Redoxin domain-containing protein n=1 Tax=Mycobacterium spongiae TaxID=886343 RepID=A0A975JU93_9MYCO|nr:deiodinase-like protein [Mycobacterium spongiae]QUR65807.1 redoxin domain-containing protein [Mycobacterium spongiae]
MTTSGSASTGPQPNGQPGQVTLAYNYARFRPSEHPLNQEFSGPKIGDRAPDFRVADIDGAEVALSDLRGRFVVLETGCATCPMFGKGIVTMNALAYRFPDVAFLVLYIREAHPGENLGPHRSQADKTAAANVLRQEDREGRRILIDTLDGQVHRAYGSMPNAVYVIDPNGIVVFRSVWNDPAAVEKALQQAMAGGDPSQLQPGPRFAPPAVIWRILRRAGGQALRDVVVMIPLAVRNFPKLARDDVNSARDGRFPRLRKSPRR